jgi:hypothetical protein
MPKSTRRSPERRGTCLDVKEREKISFSVAHSFTHLNKKRFDKLVLSSPFPFLDFSLNI